MLNILKNKKGISPYVVVAVIAVLVLVVVVLIIIQQPKDDAVTPIPTNSDQNNILPLTKTNEQQPFIQLSAQSIADEVVDVDNLYTTQPSWLVIYDSDEGGAPGEVLGNLALTPGLFQNLSVPISGTTSTVLWAVLHADEGEVGKFEYPNGTDLPLLVNNQIVAANFSTLQEEKELIGEEQNNAVKIFNITGVNFSFSQPEIRVKKGDKVRIEFTSTDGFHDWVVDEFAAATEKVNTGGSTSVEFVADKVGTFEYYCSVGQHRAMGMVGKLIVEE